MCGDSDVVGEGMRFFEKSSEWLKLQWKSRKFRVFFLMNLVLAVVLSAENVLLFSTGVLKMSRYVLLLAAVAVIACIDKKSKRIPNEILLAMLIIRVLIFFAEWISYPSYALSLLISALMGGVIGGGMFLICYLITRGGVGMGDVKLFFTAGCYLGTGGIMTVTVTTVLASAIYSIIQLIRRKAKLKDEIAFAPFVWIGLVLAMALGI